MHIEPSQRRRVVLLQPRWEALTYVDIFLFCHFSFLSLNVIVKFSIEEQSQLRTACRHLIIKVHMLLEIVMQWTRQEFLNCFSVDACIGLGHLSSCNSSRIYSKNLQPCSFLLWSFLFCLTVKDAGKNRDAVDKPNNEGSQFDHLHLPVLSVI